MLLTFRNQREFPFLKKISNGMKKRRIKINYNVRKSRNKVHPVRNDNCENDYIFLFEILSIHFFHLEFWWGTRKLQKLYISVLCTNLSAQSICLLCPKQNSKLVYLAIIGLKISSSNSFTAILGASSLLPRIKFIFYNKRTF